MTGVHLRKMDPGYWGSQSAAQRLLWPNLNNSVELDDSLLATVRELKARGLSFPELHMKPLILSHLINVEGPGRLGGSVS